MNKLLLTMALLGAVAPSVAHAQDSLVFVKVVPVPINVIGMMATVTPFIGGLKEPQGLARDLNGDIIVCDYGAGEVLRFSKAGEKIAVLATGLKSPSQIVSAGLGSFFVTERKANRVIKLSGGAAEPVGGEIIEPLGLISGLRTRGQTKVSYDSYSFFVVAHTTSKIYVSEADVISPYDGIGVANYKPVNPIWRLVYAAPDEDGDTGRYGLRCLAGDGDTVFVSDEVGGDVLMMSSGGRMAKFVSGFDDPSGMAIRGDWLYVCDEGNGGQLWKVNKNGKKTLVAEKLGRPRNVLFLDDKTALISDRDGRVLKLNWDK